MEGGGSETNGAHVWPLFALTRRGVLILSLIPTIAAWEVIHQPDNAIMWQTKPRGSYQLCQILSSLSQKKYKKNQIVFEEYSRRKNFVPFANFRNNADCTKRCALPSTFPGRRRRGPRPTRVGRTRRPQRLRSPLPPPRRATATRTMGTAGERRVYDQKPGEWVSDWLQPTSENQAYKIRTRFRMKATHQLCGFVVAFTTRGTLQLYSLGHKQDRERMHCSLSTANRL